LIYYNQRSLYNYLVSKAVACDCSFEFAEKLKKQIILQCAMRVTQCLEALRVTSSTRKHQHLTRQFSPKAKQRNKPVSEELNPPLKTKT